MDKNSRLMSLDTLRGFDMFWITGGAALVCALGNAFGCPGAWWVKQMEHVPWHGLAFMDTIFPLFLFIAGVSFPYSLAKQIEKGRTKGQIHLKLVCRGLILCFFGLVIGGIFDLKPNFRIPSVLARIGLGWMFAAIIFVNVKSNLRRALVAAGLLVGYWAALRFSVGADADPYSVQNCLPCRLDRLVMPEHIFCRVSSCGDAAYDPESLFSTFPGIVTAMLGMFAGTFLRESSASGGRKTLAMLAVAVALLGAGLIFPMPVNKALWSSSFVLVVGAYSLAMLAVFYWIVDVKGCTRWTTYFRVIGMNSITIYMAQRFIDFRGIGKFFLGGVAGLCGNPWDGVVLALGRLAVVWIFLYFLYRKNVFLKV